MIKFMQKAMAATTFPKAELVPGIIKHLGTEYPERSHKVVHASDITKSGFCPRQYALMDHYEVKRPPTFIQAGLKATFDVGNATADLVREKWMGPMAIGNWACTTCGSTSTMSRKPGEGCTGKVCNWKYEEVNFVDPASRVSGSLDVIADLKGKKLFLTEIKIMKAEDFATLKAPLAEHRIRTALYLYLVEKSGSPDAAHISTTRAKVLYVSRGFGKKQEMGQIVPFKEFDVDRDDKLLVPYLGKAQQVADYRAGLTPIPTDKACDSISCSLAKKCPVRSHCFSGEVP